MAGVDVATSASDRLFQLAGRLEGHEGFDRVLAGLKRGQAATLDGVWGSACALVAAALSDHVPASLVVVCPRVDDIDDFVDDLALFTRRTPERFPAWESLPSERVIHDEAFGDRIRLLKLLTRPDPPKLVITSVQSLLQPVPDRATLRRHTRSLCVGDACGGIGQLSKWLVENGLHNTSAVELPGEFAARGGIVDIFAPDWYDPVRVELFGDQVDSLRRFEVSSQRSLMRLDVVELTTLDPNASQCGHLAEYLPPESWFLLVEPDEIDAEGRRYLERLERPQDLHSLRAVMEQALRFAHATASAVAAGSLETACRLSIESVERFSGDITKVRDELDAAGRTALGAGRSTSPQPVRARETRAQRVRGQETRAQRGQETRAQRGPAHGAEPFAPGRGDLEDVFVVCQTEAEVERLKQVFNTTELARHGKLHWPLGNLKRGFRLVAEAVVVLSSAELFERADVRRPARRRLGRAIDSFMELREGDLVVHAAHGIARYRGMRLLEKDRRREEHLLLEFQEGTKLYVPSSKIGLVQKYVGSTRSRPRLAKLGGRVWGRQRRVVEDAVYDLAAEMLELQAKRAARPGIAFPPDTEWQREFDASFPLSETADQLATTEAIKRDMARVRPMDRLLCGDVGFGKTEIGMRATFKAVDAGYQVAVLVPTTVLAEQHLRTFSSRMAAFPFEIVSLSRFASRREQRAIIERLSDGRIDVVIGTHRLVSKDVRFHNLGLVIIDEEQRFGVEVKERLKALRETVDVLTMTATPIPRTLHMSLSGLRDISNLQTPPEDRLAVETRLARFNPELIRHAVLRELNRNGQVFFVHNRVSDIEALADRLRETVPEASLEVGHAQMPEHQLERVMIDFVHHRFDVLLATTIVESGLDIPNANTMFIDEADRYGLADLHQLRGRVGRYKHRAYCYLLTRPNHPITPNAARRLRAIEEFSDLGAGFALAMRDLEIRGAGNILGTQQSGHIALVGYELYCQLLAAAVRRLKKLPPKELIEVEVSLPCEAYIPRAYVPDMRSKIDLYRRLARVSNESELADFRAELADRFGPLPEAVRLLLALADLRIAARRWRIHSIAVRGFPDPGVRGSPAVRGSPDSARVAARPARLRPARDRFVVFGHTAGKRMRKLRSFSGDRLRIVDNQTAYLPLGEEVAQADRILASVKSLLQSE